MSQTSRDQPNSLNIRRGKVISCVRYCIIPSPVGRLLLAGDQQALHCLSFQDGKNPDSPCSEWIHDEKSFSDVMQQLREYFSGKRTTFSIELRPQGTPFQQRVWRALRKIPYGRTMSYGEIAKSIGQPTAARAVGAANGQNPLSIFVPCHRVIGQSGQLVGYGGGLEIKEKLLALERQVSSRTQQTA